MKKEHLLIVDDEEDILELLSYNLKREGYRITTADTGEIALREAKSNVPDLMILDLMLPGIGGLDICRILKNNISTESVPIIMLTARGEEADIVTGLEMGADDYITKPFSPRVLTARVKAVLRRKSETVSFDSGNLSIREINVDTEKHEVSIEGIKTELTVTEFRLLQFLASKPGRVYTRFQIIDAVRGEDHVATDRSVDVQIAGLRKKLGKCGRYIETVRGIGYRFTE